MNDNTIASIVARLRSGIKEVSADSMYSSRYLWHTFFSHAKVLIKRDADGARKIYRTANIWQNATLKMEQSSPLLCDVISLPTDCIIYKSMYKLPKMMESSFGPIVRSITSLDGSHNIVLVSPFEYFTKTKLRYNKQKYAFIWDDYLWTNVQFPILIFSGLFIEPLGSEHGCSDSVSTGDCGSVLQQSSGVPDYLVAPAISMSLQEIGAALNKPTDNAPNTSELQTQFSA